MTVTDRAPALLEGLVHGALDVVRGVGVDLLEHLVERRLALLLLVALLLQSLLYRAPVPAAGVRTLAQHTAVIVLSIFSLLVGLQKLLNCTM